MKFTLNWLKEFLDTKASLEEISEVLTNIGLEVEKIENKAEALKAFKSVEVLDVAKHPDADKLNLCKVKTEQEEFQLVCGAHNVKANMKAVLAPLGSVVPVNGMKVKKVKIRGVESIGMLCSAYELGLGTDHDGIISLPANTEIGKPVAELLNIDDPIIEIAITPNRGDCLGVYGIARDLAAAGLGTLKKPNIAQYKEAINSKYVAKIANDSCKALNFVEIRNLENKESPDWLKARLDAVGIKAKTALVDITNYIAYNFGQPMHAYDADKLNGEVVAADFAKKGSKFSALNDEEYELPEEVLAIKDSNSDLAVAGIIGGKESGCSENTKNTLLEAANFCATKITHTGRILQIDTDSRYRFERKIDAEFTKQALIYAVGLVLDICGGEASQIITAGAEKPAENIVTIAFEKLNKVAAQNIPAQEIKEILTKLGFAIKLETGENLELIVPSWRNDIAIEEDLIEEILRLRGFDKIPYENFPALNKREQNYLDISKELSMKRLLAAKGLDEIISWSFYSDNAAQQFSLPLDTKIQNPISNDLSVMRASLIPNLVEVALSEQNQNNSQSAIFEYGNIFSGVGPDKQKLAVAGLRYGERSAKEVNNSSEQYDVFDIKDDFVSLFAFLGLPEQKLNFVTDDLPDFMHPTRSSAVFLAKRLIGYFGELHPMVSQKLGLRSRLNLFEIILDNLPANLKVKAQAFKNYELQKLTRDFCFIVDEAVKAGDIKREINKADANLIEKVNIFDLYEGDKLEQGKKSLAFNVILQPAEKSLTGEELELFNQKIINNICSKFDARLP